MPGQEAGQTAKQVAPRRTWVHPLRSYESYVAPSKSRDRNWRSWKFDRSTYGMQARSHSPSRSPVGGLFSRFHHQSNPSRIFRSAIQYIHVENSCCFSSTERRTTTVNMSTTYDDEAMDLGLTNTATTIDPNVVQSRILQSASLSKEQQQDAMMEEDDDDHNDIATGPNAVVQPEFKRLSAAAARGGRSEYRRVRCPAHRYTPFATTGSRFSCRSWNISSCRFGSILAPGAWR